MKPDGGADNSDPAQQVFHSTTADVPTTPTTFEGKTGLEGLSRVARVHEEHGQRRRGMVLLVPRRGGVAAPSGASEA